jgi:hypothetical protein
VTRSRRSPEPPPEFFVDRCVGKGAPSLLRDWGWRLHLIADYYPDDAQNVADDEWMAEGLTHGWSLLTQDERILQQQPALELLRTHGGHAFCLSSAQLIARDKANRFHTHQSAIYRIARHGDAHGFFSVQPDRVTRKWPRARSN